MTYAEVNEMVSGFGLDYAYYQFPEGTEQEPPFICFFYTASNDLGADDANYAKIRTLAIELYTAAKDVELEDEIEGALNAAELFFRKEESYIDSERMHMTTFTMQVVITEEEDDADE